MDLHNIVSSLEMGVSLALFLKRYVAIFVKWN